MKPRSLRGISSQSTSQHYTCHGTGVLSEMCRKLAAVPELQGLWRQMSTASADNDSSSSILFANAKLLPQKVCSLTSLNDSFIHGAIYSLIYSHVVFIWWGEKKVSFIRCLTFCFGYIFKLLYRKVQDKKSFTDSSVHWLSGNPADLL